ncbi:minichromosome maintenance protein MCM [Candidatus Woesearchaeota archaeon]|nr:minichromosome maintenance protein MCM [Candidatus Woesearchaeota archaeon]
MEVQDQIQKFSEFIDGSCKEQLIERIKKDEKFLLIDFSELIKFEPDLAEEILEQPEETIKAAEIAIEQFDTLGEVRGFKARFFNLPEGHKIMIRNIRARHLNKILFIEGTVRQKSDVRPQVISAKFECPSCGNVLNVLQLETKFREPTRCGCGRKGKFRLLDKEMVDAQGIVLEESTTDLEGGEQPKRMNLLLKNDLVSPITEKRTNPGSGIRVMGILKEVPILAKDGGKSTRFELMIEANFVEAVEEDFSSLEITSEEEQEILDLVQDPKLHEKLVNSVVPSIYGHEMIKEAVLVQMAGGVRKVREDSSVTRGDIHVLLIGDPGAGKSQILKRISKVAPKGRFVSGKGASGAGLTAAVVKDEFMSGWSLEAGALVLANRGVCCIDELDKMSTEDRDAMHEALEGQTVTISKANIQATLRSETTVLAAANPKFGRFDPYEIIPKQIELPSTLINRFDLIFPIRDLPDAVKDDKIASFMLNIHQSPEMVTPEIDGNLLRKYFSYARQRIFPKLSDAAVDEVKKYYLKMRGSGGDEEVKAIPISARQLEALIRMAEATARLRLSQIVERKDAKKAVELMHYCLAQVGMDPETGKIDIDRISTGITASERSHISTIKEMIVDLEKKSGKTISLDDLSDMAKERGIEESIFEETIQKLKRAGDIFEPRRGFISRI